MIERRRIWSFFRGHLLATVSSMVLLFLLLVSLLGQPFLPDSTRHANRQISSLPLLKSGETYTLLQLDMGSGTHEWFPIQNPRWENDRLLYDRVMSAGGETIPQQSEKDRVLHLDETTFYLGTDALGRDLFSRLILGIKVSLLIGFFAVVVSCVVGIVIGILSGYYGGWLDTVFMTLINSMWSIPTILLVFALVLAIGRGIENIILAIGLTMWIDIARLIRGMTQTLKSRDYVVATKALSFSNQRIIWRHIFPNVLDPLIVLATANFATAILVEAGISYLGFGIQPPIPSIGILLSENYAYILGGHYVKALAPAFVIVLLVLALNMIGNALRDNLSTNMQPKTA